ncbi:ATP-binding protein [Flavobacterium sp. SM2513]|uniref:ATP-binding protein n=1 Tax=Flavobacterium sp. SM2513 TaxID=3424766 RepID=UPI003D7F933B
MARYKRISGGEKNELSGTPFSREELEKVYELYVTIDGKGIHENNPKIHLLAEQLERTIRSVENQLLGYRVVDTGKTGRVNHNQLIKTIWEEKTVSGLSYTVSSGLKNLIGKQLITDEYVAVFELVKNSFDAHATKTIISFENLNTDKAKIVIKDNGKGMNFQQLKDKWLFVAYSAKKQGIEDDDYRNNLGVKKYYAGAKGVGRFSCDKLGSKLRLITKHDELNAKTEILDTDWSKFEEDPKARFEEIGVTHKTDNLYDFPFDHGTILEITDLEIGWDRPKLLELKKKLEKLILPEAGYNEVPLEDKARRKFEITLNVPDELEEDGDPSEDTSNYYKRVNGTIKNFIFETLKLRTTTIEVQINSDGSKMTTKLIDRGEPIYKITEGNKFKKLKDIEFKLFHMNTAAKGMFTRTMGFPVYSYGHVLLYKNGFRIYPFGDFEEDSLGVEIRKSQKERSRLGTRSITGRIEIKGDNPEFQESTSRDGGLIENDAFIDLKTCYHEILTKFERYVVDIIIWGKDIDIEDLGNLDNKNKMNQLIEELTGSDSIVDLWYSDKLIDILATKQETTARNLLSNLQRVAEQSGNIKLLDDVVLAQQRLNDLEERTKEAERIAEESESSIEEVTQALEFSEEQRRYLETKDRTISDDARALLHSIKIVTNKIYSNIEITTRKLKEDKLSQKELLERLGMIRLSADKAVKISKLITRADFKGQSEKKTINIAQYLEEYLFAYGDLFDEEGVNFEVARNSASLIRKINLLDLSIAFDNLIANSEKAGAKTIRIDLSNVDNKLEVLFSDDGNGLDSKYLKTPDIIFSLGITNTDGSGIGLHTVRKMLKLMKAKVDFVGNGILQKGACFKITFD